MLLTWNGHACFTFDTGEGVVVFDPYEPDYVPGLHLPPLAGDVVLCSHDHNDHGYADGVQRSRRRPGFAVEVVETCHDDAGGSLRGANKVHIIDVHGFRLAHLGDLGHVLTDEQAAAMGRIDAVLVPIGDVYTLNAHGAKAVCEQLRPRLIFPMHYRTEEIGFDNIDTLDLFLSLYPAAHVVDGDTADLTTCPDGVVVFSEPRSNGGACPPFAKGGQPQSGRGDRTPQYDRTLLPTAAFYATSLCKRGARNNCGGKQMSTQITNYQCPACTAPLTYKAKRGKLECDYCLSSFTVAEIEQYYKEATDKAAAAKEDAGTREQLDEQWGEDARHMRAYSCPSCGAQLICDDTMAATACPYCNNPTVVPGQFAGTRRPDYVIPFKCTKEDAMAALRNHCKGKLLLPKAFKTEHHIREIKGIYVPFWMFDGKAEADVTYTATISHRHFRGDDEIIKTQHYLVRRAGTVDFDGVPVDGAGKMPDDYMDAIEPYDYAELKPFAMAYLPGFLADKFDVDDKQSFQRAEGRMRNSAYDAMFRTVGIYETCVPVKQEAKVTRTETKYALMPVWMLNTRYKGKDYLFAMNGQTGKIVGELPISWGRFFAWLAGITAGLTAVCTAVLMCL